MKSTFFPFLLLFMILFVCSLYYTKKWTQEGFDTQYSKFFQESYHKDYSYSQERPDCIFVSIASYRDSECRKTLEDMFEKAKEPEKIFVGLCQQNKDQSEECIIQDFKYMDQVRINTVSHMEARGPTWARYVCSHLWDGEEFFLQIDSHSRFLPNWDEKTKQMYQMCPPGKNVLSHYPPSHGQYDGIMNNPAKSYAGYICSSHFENKFHIISEAKIPKNKRDRPFITPYVAAGFLFAPSKLLHEVPFDPYLPYLFQGEEILLASRFYTHGWNVYNLYEPVITHFYDRQKKNYPHFWHDHKNWNKIQTKANKRYYYLLGQYSADKVDPEFLTHAEDYGMGTERKLSDWFEFAGIDMKNKEITSRCNQYYNEKAKKWEQLHGQ